MRWRVVLATVAAIGLCGASVKPPQANNDHAGAHDPQGGAEMMAPSGSGNEGSASNYAPQKAADGLSAYERESLAVDRAANNIGEVANRIAERQRVYGFWQLVASGFGVFFTGIAAFFAYRATHWAKEAATQTKRSADADNAALAETRTAAEEARKEAGEQAERLKKQLELAEQNVSIAKETAVNTDRAWLKITVKEAGDLIFAENSISLRVSTVIENIGRGPAVSVLQNHQLTPDLAGFESALRQRTYWSRSSLIPSGRVMFPGDRDTWVGEIRMTRAEFDAAIVQAAKTIVDDADYDGCPYVSLTLIVGAEYNLPGDRAYRMTYVFGVLAKSDEAGHRFYGTEKTIKLDNLQLWQDLHTGPIA
jgi:hypothetical protein